MNATCPMVPATATAALVVVLALLTMPVAGAGQNNLAPGQRSVDSRDLALALGDPGPTGRTVVPRGYALVIGIGDYRNLGERQQLRYAQSDAEAMYRVLISHEGGAIPPENVRVLLGEQATLENIRVAVEEWLPSIATPADRVVVYFVGHGFVKDGRGYLAPSDVEMDRLEETAYPMAALGEAMANRIQARWKVLLADACHSGKINFETTNEALDQQFSGLPQDFLTLTASRERELSYADGDLHGGAGLFTHYLVEGWRGVADHDPCDGRVTADEIIEYVRTQVRRHVRDVIRKDPAFPQASQTPTARGDYDPGMLLGVGRTCLGTVDPKTPSMLGTAVVEVNLDQVDLYLDGELEEEGLSSVAPFVIPNLAAGLHEFMGVRRGYEPDRKRVMIAPGQEVTVTLRIRYVRRIKSSAIELGERGERLLFTQRSSLNPLNLLPVGRSQSLEDVREARDFFAAALAEDPSYGRAAYHLAQAHQLLGDYEKSLEGYRTALTIDPSDVDARVQLGAVLLESGDPDEAIRELTDAARLERNDELNAMLARAYWDKGAWEQCVEWATRAIALNESNPQAHLWRADAQRQLAAATTRPVARQALFREAREGYHRFLKLTNFRSSIGERLAFHFIGFGIGSRRHADREGVWRDLRTAAYLGLCITENRAYNPLRAREYCRRAVDHNENNAVALFLLGNIHRDLFNLYQECEHLTAAAASYERMLAVNEFLAEGDNARNYLEQIRSILPRLRC